MRISLLITIITTCCHLTLAQPVKRLIAQDPVTGTTEKYHVLKSDKNLKHGLYELYRDWDNALVRRGYYRNGLPDSIWTEYAGKQVETKGWYRNGVKAGIWEHYSYHGVLIDKYDYDNGKLLYHEATLSDSTAYRTISGIDTLVTKVDHGPIFLGEPSRFLAMILRYPRDAREKFIQGRVIIEFVVDEKGQVLNPRIRKPIYPSLDAEAMRCFNKIEQNWVPATLNGKPIAVITQIPVTFALEYNPSLR